VSDARERAERAAAATSFPVGTVTYQLARDLLAALDRADELERAIARINLVHVYQERGKPEAGISLATAIREAAALASAAATEQEPTHG